MGYSGNPVSLIVEGHISNPAMDGTFTTAGEGDSGGPLLIKERNGSYCSIGVVATGGPDMNRNVEKTNYLNIHSDTISEWLKENNLEIGELEPSPWNIVLDGEDTLIEEEKPEVVIEDTANIAATINEDDECSN